MSVVMNRGSFWFIGWRIVQGMHGIEDVLRRRFILLTSSLCLPIGLRRRVLLRVRLPLRLLRSALCLRRGRLEDVKYLFEPRAS